MTIPDQRLMGATARQTRPLESAPGSGGSAADAMMRRRFGNKLRGAPGEAPAAAAAPPPPAYEPPPQQAPAPAYDPPPQQRQAAPPPPQPPPADDFLSEFGAPEPKSEPKPQPAARPASESPRSLIAAAEERASGRSSSATGTALAIRDALAPAKGAAPDGDKKRSREFALNFDRLRKFGFITPGVRRSRLSEEIRLIKRRLIRRMTLEETTAVKRTAGSRARSPRGRQHVVLVTSAKPSEGKSFIAVNLALSIVLDEGLNVLLVDADAARPSLSKIFGLKPDLTGLTDLLVDRKNAPDVGRAMLRAAEHPLTFIPAGGAVASATNLFGGDAMRALMADLADRYTDRIIIIDGPPLLASTEPVELSRHVGQVALVIDAERTSRTAVESALDLLGPEANVNLILNKAAARGRVEQFGSYYEAYANESAPEGE